MVDINLSEKAKVTTLSNRIAYKVNKDYKDIEKRVSGKK